MKIGIVTQTLNRNYGGILQNYALQQVLKNLGHESMTIDCTPITPYYIWVLSCLKTLLYKARGKNRKFMGFPKPLERNSSLKDFISKHINCTEEVHEYYPMLVEQYKLDAIIVGSDQVWRPRYNRCIIYDTFLRFVQSEHTKRIAFAASFGVDYWEFSKNETQKCAKLAKRFNAISVREDSGVILCNKYLGVDAEPVLDPTLLLNKYDYSFICAHIPKRNSDYLVAYILDITDEKKKLIEDIASEQDLAIVSFTADEAATLSISEWLAMFRDASYVVTDSFHGTVFSIINNHPFLSIPNSKRGSSRFQSLLQRLGLEDRLITDVTTLPKLSDIDWDVVMLHIDEWRKRSVDFLINSLK